MVRIVRPGGVVALHEADLTARVYDPPLAAWARLSELLDTYAEVNGIDRLIGRRVPRMLREAGVQDVHVTPTIHLYPAGHARRMVFLDLVENVRDRIVGRSLIGEAELDQLIAAVKRHLEDPGTLVLSSLYIQAWGHIRHRSPPSPKRAPESKRQVRR